MSDAIDSGTTRRCGSGSVGRETFGVLMAASLVAAVISVPYVTELLEQRSGAREVLLGVLLFSQLFTYVVFSVPAVALGVWLGGKVGLGAPLLCAWRAGDSDGVRRARALLPGAAAIGAILGVVMLGASLVGPRLFPELHAPITPPSPWAGFLGSVSAGISEEIWMRLGLMTVLAWLGTRLLGTPQPTATIIWVANAAAALAFGALHLPLASALVPLTGVVVAWVIAANALAGLVFGWLYWRRGLEAAMMAHFTTDVVLHTIAPAIGMG
ncbi:MAG: CPBP family intramembrane metalloprotease [Luteitalea sp.]|nr:CPBP family intramembrane metalloprotease [Luteitalea sp.]